MTLRGLPDRARLEGMRAIRTLVDGVRGRFSSRSASDLYLVPGGSETGRDNAVWLSRTEPDARDTAPDPDAVGTAREEPEVAKALDRVAETIDRLAAQLDAHNDERAEQLEAIEFLLREMLLGGTTSARPVVLGGVMDPDAPRDPAVEITLVTDGFPLETDTPVEVRSRFHDRWICGFAVAEAIENGAGPCRYRLTRRSDGIPLPILFDARDVRAASSLPERQPAAD
jgi:hypothetical protein